MENTPNLSTPVAIIVAGVIIAGAVYFGLISRSPVAGTGQTAGVAAANIKDVKITADDPYIGSLTTPVTIAYWSDYQCPFCKAVEVGGVPQITQPPALPSVISNYVDTGKVKIVFKDFAFLGNDSTDRKSTRLNSSHSAKSRMPSSA